MDCNYTFILALIHAKIAYAIILEKGVSPELDVYTSDDFNRFNTASTRLRQLFWIPKAWSL